MDVVGGNDASTHDLAVSDLEAYNDGGLFDVAKRQLPASIQAVMVDRIVPQQWGRYVTTVTRTISRTDSVGDTVSIARADITFSGNYVIVGTVNGVLDTITKPFTASLHRLFRFVRVANTNHPRMNWRLDAVSILEGGTSNAQISITQVQVVPPSGDTIVATVPDNFFMQLTRGWMRHPLPQWGVNTTVTVIATVHSTDPDSDLVAMHYSPTGFGLHRSPMTLVSSTANPNGGTDRVYSTTLTIPGNGRKFSHVLVSATTSASLYSTDTTQFSSVVWGVPYKTSE
jgi:hypothetical protein